jgi:hypothetical protein
MKKKWYTQKTIWAGVAAVIGAVGGYVTGDMGAAGAFQTALTGLIGIFMRQAVN